MNVGLDAGDVAMVLRPSTVYRSCSTHEPRGQQRHIIDAASEKMFGKGLQDRHLERKAAAFTLIVAHT